MRSTVRGKSASTDLLNDSNHTDKPNENLIHLQPTLFKLTILLQKVEKDQTHSRFKNIKETVYTIYEHPVSVARTLNDAGGKRFYTIKAPLLPPMTGLKETACTHKMDPHLIRGHMTRLQPMCERVGGEIFNASHCLLRQSGWVL